MKPLTQQEQWKHEKCWSSDGLFWHCSDNPHDNCEDCVSTQQESSDWRKEYREMVYAYNRKEMIFGIERKMMEKLEAFIATELQKQRAQLLVEVRSKLKGHDYKCNYGRGSDNCKHLDCIKAKAFNKGIEAASELVTEMQNEK